MPVRMQGQLQVQWLVRPGWLSARARPLVRSSARLQVRWLEPGQAQVPAHSLAVG